jgi:hypothetical protein
MITQSDFLSGLEAEQHLRGLSLTRADVLAFSFIMRSVARARPGADSRSGC